ncbi:MAG TPA: murein biosynthesis integral membrane protein MurJ [Desulfurobacteriaceae bacterium]|nr:murein biosynthesis integral membrane protein MurJ [Desulfurobacteriaceae bacterium]
MKRLIKKIKLGNNAKFMFISSFGILLSRISGFLRDLTVAYYFGANVKTDIFFLAFKIPNTLRHIFAEGALSNVFLPKFIKLLKINRKKAYSFLNLFLLIWSIILLILIFLGIENSYLIIKFLAPGYDESLLKEASYYLKLLFPFIFFISIIAILGGSLEALNDFWTFSVSTVFFNLGIIFGIILFQKKFDIEALIIGVYLGVFFQLLFVGYKFLRKKLFYKPSLEAIKDVIFVLKNFIFSFLIGALKQISIIIDTIFATFLEKGAISYLYYSFRLLFLPIGLVTIAINKVALKDLSEKIAKLDLKILNKDIERTLKLAYFLILFTTLLFGFFGLDTVKVLFAHGKFTSQDAYKTYLALLGSLPGLVFATLSRIYFNIYLAKEKPRSLVPVSLFTLTLNTIFDYIFIFILPLGIFGLPFATSISYFITFIFLTFKVKKDFFISLSFSTYLYFFKLLTFGLFIGFLVFKISNNFENLYFRTIFEYIIFTLLYFLGGYFLFKKDILEIIKI